MRGVPLSALDERTRAGIDACDGLIDTVAAHAAWHVDVHAAAWTERPVWVHGDMAPGNLIARDGVLSGVIDWGGLGVGDPAVDLLPAWNLFEGASRSAYREALQVSEATWMRGRAWAPYMGVIALPYYLDTNPVIVRWARRIIGEVLDDHCSASG